MDHVVRREIVQIDFDIGDAFKQLTKDIDNMRKQLTGSFGDDALDDLKKGAAGASDGLDKVKKSAGEVTKKVTEIGQKASAIAFKGLKKLAGISFKALTVSATAASTAVGGLVTKSVAAYADYEQFVGGVETLFGANGAKDVNEYAALVGKSVTDVQGEYDKLMRSQNAVLKNANDAFKTAGLSSNEYMETVTSFSASLIASCGGDTQEAAELAHMAITDMADNANKMGTDMGSIQWAYQGFAKQNYTMLDNLKLGYGGTKEEMARLVKDAAKLDKSINANSMSYGNIVKAINAVQRKMKIYGTTQKEAEGTITGSLNMVKAAWGNLMPALIQGGDSFDQCVDNLIYSVKKFAGNVKPAILKALSGVATLIDELVPIIVQETPVIANELLPPLIKAVAAILAGLIKALPGIVSTAAKEIPGIFKTLGRTIAETFGEQFPSIRNFGNFFSGLGNSLKNNTGMVQKTVVALLGLAAASKAFKGISAVTSLFGKSKGGKGGGGLFGNLITPFKELAKVKSATILKGMANLALIIGGFTILAAAFLATAPLLAKMADVKSILKVTVTITAMGVMGAALAKLGSIAGKIPVATVAKGFANMAIMLGGMSALFLVIGAVSLIDFNMKKMLAITAVIGVLGTVGAALSVFAGIVGLVPIPVVLAGLANMALVLGGVSAILIAFGALSKIQHFDEFITTGGDALANLFNQIGKMGGALVGGIGEGVSNSLPKIGANLSVFAASLAPMFQVIKGVDMGGVGSFFRSIGGFMLKIAGSNLISFFTGGANFAGIGSQLTEFAAKSQGFFTRVAKFPENGFSNAAALFQSLSDIGNVPKTGGIAQWFSGESDFTALAAGLGQLSNQNVVSFYETVSKIPQAGFENAKTMFQSFADIGNIPNTGGVAQWFTGTKDFAGLASKLLPLGKAMAAFYHSIEGISDFSKISQFFESMKNIDKAFPKKGGVSQWFSGDSNISGLGADLKKFGIDTKEFFTQVNALNVEKLNGLWDSLKNAKGVTASISRVIDEHINDLVRKISELPKKMGDGLRSAGKSLSDSLVSIWNDAVKASVAPVNKVLDAANWILKEFGSAKRVIPWQPYAKGTDGHKGGNALVNDGSGAELVQMPNGNTFIPKGKNVFLPNAPKGMKVLPADQTAQLLGRKSPSFSYANDSGNPKAFNLWGSNAYKGYMKGVGGLAEGHRPQPLKSLTNLTYTPEGSNSNVITKTVNETTYAPQFTLSINGAGMSERELEKKTKHWVKESMAEMFARLEQRKPRLTEV